MTMDVIIRDLRGTSASFGIGNSRRSDLPPLETEPYRLDPV
jgi:hypothetical protein